MSVEHNKAVVRRYYEGDHDGRDNTEHWDEICDPNLALYAAILPAPIHDLQAIKQFTAAAHSALSGFAITVDEMLAEGDKVAVRWTMGGTHTSPLMMPGMNMPPTGRKIAVTGISVLRLSGGKITEERVEADWLGMMQQLGAIPTA